MLTVQESNSLRKEFYAKLIGMTVGDYAYDAQIKEGMVFSDPASENFVVVKVVVKKEGFDILDAIEEYEIAETKRIERETARDAKAKERAAEKEAKAKAKAEKEAKAKAKAETKVEPNPATDSVDNDGTGPEAGPSDLEPEVGSGLEID